MTVEDFSDMRSGFTIQFNFEENPFFSDKDVSKSFEYDLEDGGLLCSSTGIHWYPGKVRHFRQVAVQGLLCSQSRTVVGFQSSHRCRCYLQDPALFDELQDERKRARGETEESFFLWFPPEGESYHTTQDQVADMIKDHLWVNPLKYYLGDLEVQHYYAHVPRPSQLSSNKCWLSSS